MMIPAIKQTCSGLATLILVLIFFAQNGYAHKVTVFAWVEGDRVLTESKFAGGKRVVNTPIIVFDAMGTKILEGKTDDNGAFSFKFPEKTTMKIVLQAGMGHRAEWTIPVEAFSGDAGKAEKIQTQTNGPDHSPPETDNDGTKPSCMTEEMIQKIVSSAVAEALAPLADKLNRPIDPQKEPGITDILGGIGYIFGLVGIGAYYNYRKKSKNSSNK